MVSGRPRFLGGRVRPQVKHDDNRDASMTRLISVGLAVGVATSVCAVGLRVLIGLVSPRD